PGDRRGKAVEQDADGDRERDAPAAPAEVGLERLEERAGRGPHTGRDEDDEERGHDDEPGVVALDLRSPDAGVAHLRFVPQHWSKVGPNARAGQMPTSAPVPPTRVAGGIPSRVPNPCQLPVARLLSRPESSS